MPRRNEPDHLARAVGRRIRMLRKEAGLSLQELADRSELGSKGHLSSVERGLVRPNIQTLKQIADGLGVLPLDLMTFPTESLRERLVEISRSLRTRGLRSAIGCVNRAM